MTVQRHGVPHQVTFDWRGAFLWMLQLSALVVVAGVVK